jgi:O-antigen/teichoic acid export membrane protein
MEPVPVALAPYGRLIGMSAAFATSNLARMAISFATSLVIGRALGVDDFGRWTLCIAWASLLTAVADLGFGVLLTRRAARDDPSIGTLVAVAFIMRLGVLLPMALIFVMAPSYFSPDATTAAALRFALVIALAGAAYGCLASVFCAWPGALVVALGIETAGAIAQWGGAWWLVRTGHGITGLLALASIVQVVQLAAAIALWFALRSRWTPLEWPTSGTFARVAREASAFAAAGLITNGQARLAPVLLGVLTGPAALATFGVAARIGGIARMLPHAAFAAALPVLSDEARRGTSERVRAAFDRALLGFAVAAAAGLAFFGRPSIALTYGDAFGAAVLPLGWTAAGLLPTLVNSGRRVYLNASGLETVAVKWSAVALAIQAAACCALIPPFGATGAAAALALGEALVWWPLHKAGARVGELRAGRAMHGSPIVG